ncbi:hypothetical protein A3F62_01800 [Candidatus Woesebacteria bacterium RIFCSPHIGHO2_12_FULL_44_11]|nr:MAG: hypothetical protein A3F62_01800 [Candidatus Woesebacteria bacterium RIFCSPHIGHO2_12_FULL_44_11]
MIKTVTVITDCHDNNAAGRQKARLSSLFACPVNLIGVKNDLEASGNLIDILDAVGEEETLILVNVAPRNGRSKRWKNGTPFGYFYFENTLTISTVDGYCLSLVKKLGLISKLKLLNIREVDTQFRSYQVIPSIAERLVRNKRSVFCEVQTVNKLANPTNTIWWVDNFGNCKTTLFKDDIEVVDGKINTKVGSFEFFPRLKDIPDGKTAVVVGSSGIKEKRFLEIVVQGGNAAKQVGLSVGVEI